MASITLHSVESKATKYIPHTDELFCKFQKVLTKFPGFEEDCYVEYLEPEEDEDEPGLHIHWANETPAAFTDAQIYYASPLDLSSSRTADIEELQCLYNLIGDFEFYVSGSSSHGDEFDSKVYVSDGQVEWEGDWR